MVTMVEPGTFSADIARPEFGMVPADAVPYLWHIILPVLVDKGKKWLEVVDENDVFGHLRDGNMDLWCAMEGGVLDGVVICQWERHARANYYHVTFMGGEGVEKYMPEGLQKLERYAAIMGAREVVAEGRRGLQRLLQRYGYYSNTVRMRKNVRMMWSN